MESQNQNVAHTMRDQLSKYFPHVAHKQRVDAARIRKNAAAQKQNSSAREVLARCHRAEAAGTARRHAGSPNKTETVN